MEWRTKTAKTGREAWVAGKVTENRPLREKGGAPLVHQTDFCQPGRGLKENQGKKENTYAKGGGPAGLIFNFQAELGDRQRWGEETDETKTVVHKNRKTDHLRGGGPGAPRNKLDLNRGFLTNGNVAKKGLKKKVTTNCIRDSYK